MAGAREIEVVGEIEVIKMTDGAGGEVTVIEEVSVVREEEHPSHVEVSVEHHGDGAHRREHFPVSRGDALLHVLDEGARKLHLTLLPDAQKPLDHLRGVHRDHEAGAPLNLDLTVGDFLKDNPVTHHFAVELVLAIQINTRWRVAPENEMTPKAILILAGLSPEDYDLYLAAGKVPLPPDTPVGLHRGERFEAQRKGQYG